MLYQKGDPYDYHDARFQPPEDPTPLCTRCLEHDAPDADEDWCGKCLAEVGA